MVQEGMKKLTFGLEKYFFNKENSKKVFIISSRAFF